MRSVCGTRLKPGRVISRCQHRFHTMNRSLPRLASRAPVELKAVAGLHSHIDWGHEVLPRLENSLGIGNAAVFVLKELLSNPTEESALRRTWLVGTAHIGLSRSRARQKTEKR